MATLAPGTDFVDVIDGLEAVTLNRRGSSSDVSVTSALQRNVSTAELAPYGRAFVEGAHFAWGHALLRATAGVGATGAWAVAHFGEDAVQRNRFFQRVGRGPYPDEETMRRLTALGPEAEPGDVVDVLEV